MTVHDSRNELRNCPTGWQGLVNKLVEDLNNYEADIYILQVKEKFGGLRFYVSVENVSDEDYGEIISLIGQAERDSFMTCEVCSNQAELDNTYRWSLTLCDEHREDRRRRREEELRQLYESE